MNFCCFDIETKSRDGAETLIPTPIADGRLTDPFKMAADVAKKYAALVDKLALDENGNAIVCIGIQTELMHEPAVFAVNNAIDERGILNLFWDSARGRTLVGYCSRTFDLRTIIQRSRYLQVDMRLNWRDLLAPYGRSRHHIDLFDELTMDSGRGNDGVIPRKLDTFCQTFAVDAPLDETRGSDVAALLKAGDLAAVVKHCESDVRKTVALAIRLGIIPAQTIAQPDAEMAF